MDQLKNELKDANQLYKQERYKECLVLVQKILSRKPDIYEANVMKGRSLRKLGKEEEAINCLKSCIELKKTKPQAYVDLIIIYRSKKDYENEKKYIDMALKNMPEDTNIQKQEAISLFSRKEYENALKIYEKLINKVPTDVSLKIDYIKVLNRCFKFEEADKLIDDIIRQYPSTPNYHQVKSSLYKFRMQYLPAIEEIDKAYFYEKSNNLPYLIEKLVLKYYHGDYDEVIEQGDDLVNEKILKDEQYFTHFSFLFYYACACRNKKADNPGEINKKNNQFKKYLERYLARQKYLNEEIYLEYAKVNFEKGDVKLAEDNLYKAYNLYGDKTDFPPLINFMHQYLKTLDVTKAKEFQNKYFKYINLYNNRDSLDNQVYNNTEMEISNTQTVAIDDEEFEESSNMVSNPQVSKSIYNLDLPSLENLNDSQIQVQDIKEKIGGGGFAEVYKETDKYTRKIIAAKYLKLDPNLTEKQRKIYQENLNKEVKVMLDLNHRNIVPIILFHKEIFMIELELESGGDLKTTYTKFNPLPDDFKLYLIKEIANGLEYLHSQKVIHGDIKCNNVLLDKPYDLEMTKDNYPIPKLSDFGLSDVEGSEVLGFSSRYTSPELLNDIERKKNGEKIKLKKEETSDIFSFGMMIFEIIFQHFPFPDLTGEEANQSIMEGKLPDVEQLECGKPMKELIYKCLAFNKNDRPKISEITLELSEIEKL